MRRDTNNTSIRLDYSNLPGYWNSIVDSPGIQTGNADKRFFAPTFSHWEGQFDKLDFESGPQLAARIREEIDAALFWSSEGDCPRGEGLSFAEGFGAYVDGRIDANFYYGFSVVGTEFPMGDVVVDQASSFLKVTGSMDITYGIGGIGVVDISATNKGNPAISDVRLIKLSGQSPVVGGRRVRAYCDPYIEITYQMATLNGTDGDLSDSTTFFNGRLSARVITNLGSTADPAISFPSPYRDGGEVTAFSNREPNKIHIPNSDLLYDSPEVGGKIALGTFVRFGLKLRLPSKRETVDISLVYNTISQFSYYPSGPEESCTEYEVVTNIYQRAENTGEMDWGEDETDVQLVLDAQSPDRGSVCYSNAEEDYTPDNRLLARNASNTQALSPRQTYIFEMPGWENQANDPVSPDTYFASESITDLLGESDLQFNCGLADCHTCELVWDRRRRQCCGCVNMDVVYGFNDLEHYEGYSYSWECGGPVGERGYPGPVLSEQARRSIDSEEVSVSDEEQADDTQLQVWSPREDPHALEKRAWGEATVSPKRVTACNIRFSLAGDGQYPAFPAMHNYPWDSIENGRWDSISRYWGNSSADCADWAISARRTADTRWANDQTGRPVNIRANYQTEHVFEGQLIGDFFTMWLDRGKITSQLPALTTLFASTRLSCRSAQRWFLTADVGYPWQRDNRPVPFIHLLLAELGSIEHLDRLTIMLGRPNGKKGTMFRGFKPTDHTKYRRMSKDAQLQSVKEMALVVNYMNDEEIWFKFCATYEAVYLRFLQWDEWYNNTQVNPAVGRTIPNMADEWKLYIRVVLNSFILNARWNFNYFVVNRKLLPGGVGDPPYTTDWFTNLFTNRAQLRLNARVCRYMDPHIA